MRVALAQFGIRGADVLKYRIDAAEPVYDGNGYRAGGFLYGVRRVKTRLLTKPSALTVDG